MRVLTIKQPYASLIVHGYKKYEFRNWRTKYRGKLYIHASSTVDKKAMAKYENLNLPHPTGVIVGQVDLVDCVLAENVLDKAAKKTNNYRYAFVLKNAIQINSDEKIKGRLGIWHWKNKS